MTHSAATTRPRASQRQEGCYHAAPGAAAPSFNGREAAAAGNGAAGPRTLHARRPCGRRRRGSGAPCAPHLPGGCSLLELSAALSPPRQSLASGRSRTHTRERAERGCGARVGGAGGGRGHGWQGRAVGGKRGRWVIETPRGPVHSALPSFSRRSRAGCLAPLDTTARGGRDSRARRRLRLGNRALRLQPAPQRGLLRTAGPSFSFLFFCFLDQVMLF